MKEFKNLKFKSVTPQDILQAVGLLDKLGYEVVRNDFSVYDAASHNGICAWDDGEITEGWLDDDNFEQVALEDLKEMVGEMVGETNKCNTTLSNNFSVAWEQVFGEAFIDSVIKAVKQNRDSTINNDKFTLERLLGCEVKINHSGVTGYVTDIIDNGYALYICCGDSFDVVSKYYLTFFTEDGDEVAFEEYVSMYYGFEDDYEKHISYI